MLGTKDKLLIIGAPMGHTCFYLNLVQASSANTKTHVLLLNLLQVFM